MARGPIAMLEGALGERLKREFGLPIDGPVAMADLVLRPEGRAALLRLWREYRDIAWAHGLPFFATTPTRRANRARMERAGHGPELIAQNVALLRSLAQGGPMCVGGLMGCRGDAYTGEGALPRQEARAFHRWQAEAFRRAGADFLLAGILPTAPEAQGMAQAMAETGLPYVLSLTLRRDGRLVDGTRLCDLIRETDALLGQGRPAFYMSNCIHPDAVRAALDQAFNRCGAVQARFLGVQANPSPRSFAELDGAEALQGDAPEPWAEAMLRLHRAHPMRLLGGCCGTDGRHMAALAARLTAEAGN